MTKEVAAAELALKAYTMQSGSVTAERSREKARIIQEIAGAVDLTEAPEDAVCSLVIDLMHYCKQEGIDWRDDVVSRARRRFRNSPRDLRTR